MGVGLSLFWLRTSPAPAAPLLPGEAILDQLPGSQSADVEANAAPISWPPGPLPSVPGSLSATRGPWGFATQ